MPVLIIYLLKLSISLSVTWLFYQSMLRRLIFYSLNRWYLPGYSLLSFIIPLNGVILPETKPKAVPVKESQIRIMDDKKDGRIVVRADTTAMPGKMDPLKDNVYFLNGVKVKDAAQG